MTKNNHNAVRESAVAGVFFPNDPTKMHNTVKSCFARSARVSHHPDARAKAIISPHAGYQFSGALAAAAWRTTAGRKIERIVILSPSHKHAFDGIALPSQLAYKMPGFDVAIDGAARNALVKAGLALVLDAAHDREHGVETQLAFMHRLHPKARIVPLVIGRSGIEQVARLVDFLADLDPDTLFVLSSDLSHFLPLQKANDKDLETASFIETGRMDQITAAHACGAKAITGYMASDTAQGARVQRLGMAGSFNVTQDAKRTVGYGAWAFYDPVTNIFASDMRQELLRVARQSQEIFLRTGEVPQANLSSFRSVLRGFAPSFVTVEKQGRLRGCIGSLAGHQPLVMDVAENAVKAGFKDPRFRPMTAAELTEVSLKIAVLSPSRPMTFSDENDLLQQITPGKDGLIMIDGPKRGIFLPMVWDSLPTAPEFLNGLKVKSGLPATHWSNTLKIRRFRAETFSEKDFAA